MGLGTVATIRKPSVPSPHCRVHVRVKCKPSANARNQITQCESRVCAFRARRSANRALRGAGPHGKKAPSLPAPKSQCATVPYVRASSMPNARIQITQHATRACGVSEWCCAREGERGAPNRSVQPCHVYVQAQCQRTHSDHATCDTCMWRQRVELCEREARERGGGWSSHARFRAVGLVGKKCMCGNTKRNRNSAVQCHEGAPWGSRCRRARGLELGLCWMRVAPHLFAADVGAVQGSPRRRCHAIMTLDYCPDVGNMSSLDVG